MDKLKKAILWLRKKFGILKKEEAEKSQKSKSKDSLAVGNLYVFIYDPKHKLTLPYYDKFPVIILLSMEKDGFLGINLHYLPPKYRIQFLYKLFPYAKRDGDNMKLTISYEMLKLTSQLKEFKPCLKRYLFSHIRSQIYKIPTEEWEMVMLLPSDNFEKATAQKIWEDSLTLINQT